MRKPKPEPATVFPTHVPPAEVTVPLKCDPDAPCMQPLRIEPDATHVHPGAICTVNPVVINDTLRQSPFKTAAQVMAHDLINPPKAPSSAGSAMRRP